MRVRLSWYTVARQNEYQSLASIYLRGSALSSRSRYSLARSLAGLTPHHAFVTTNVTLVSGAAHSRLSPAPTRSLRTQIFTVTLCFTGLYSVLVMSARKRKERSSDSQIFDSIQGNCPRVILSVCHTSGPFFFFRPPLPQTTNNSAKDLVLRIKTKLNHRADSQSAYPALVTELYELSTLSERLLILRSNSSESLLDDCQADVLDREGLSHLFRRPLTSLHTSPCPNRNLFMEPFQLYASLGG